jgi:hypothetical protein
VHEGSEQVSCFFRGSPGCCCRKLTKNVIGCHTPQRSLSQWLHSLNKKCRQLSCYPNVTVILAVSLDLSSK